MKSLLSEGTPSDVKFGNYCVYLRALNRYLYQGVVIVLIYCSSLFYAVSNNIYKKKVYAYNFWLPTLVYREKERITRACPTNSGGQVVVRRHFVSWFVTFMSHQFETCYIHPLAVRICR